MMPKEMIQRILNEAQGESKIKTAPIECDGIKIERGLEIRKAQAGSFSVATFVIVGFVSPKARAMYEDGQDGWEFMWRLATEEQKQIPGVLLQVKGWEQYEIWPPEDVAGQMKINQMFSGNVTPLG